MGSNPLGERDWQNWDVPGIADTIEAYWQGSALEHQHREWLAALAAPHLTSPTVRVLEVGCGSGLVYGQLAPAIIPETAYTGVDVSERMLDIARRNFPNGRFLLGDGYGLDFPDGAFDVVLCFEVLGHIPEIDRFIGELLRVARYTTIMTFWSSPTDEIVEGSERLGDVRFLHRSYPEAMVERAVRRIVTDGAMRFEPVSLEKTACIVQRRP